MIVMPCNPKCLLIILSCRVNDVCRTCGPTFTIRALLPNGCVVEKRRRSTGTNRKTAKVSPGLSKSYLAVRARTKLFTSSAHPLPRFDVTPWPVIPSPKTTRHDRTSNIYQLSVCPIGAVFLVLLNVHPFRRLVVSYKRK